MHFSFKVSLKEINQRLDVFLTKKFTYHDRKRWQILIQENEILVNNCHKKASYLLKLGDIILYKPKDNHEPPVKNKFEILYEDEFCIALNKPSDLPTHSVGRYYKNNLISILESEYKQKFYPVHRLDRETSGCLLVAKDKQAALEFSLIFEKCMIKKLYFCYVFGNFQRNKSYKGSLVQDKKSKIRKKQVFIPDNTNHSYTKLRKIKFQNDISKIACKPITGRMHQIRATLFSLGYPLIGDKIYGKDENAFLHLVEGKDFDFTKNLGLNRQALHCARMSFFHPFFKKWMKINCIEPAELLYILS